MSLPNEADVRRDRLLTAMHSGLTAQLSNPNADLTELAKAAYGAYRQTHLSEGVYIEEAWEALDEVEVNVWAGMAAFILGYTRAQIRQPRAVPPVPAPPEPDRMDRRR